MASRRKRIEVSIPDELKTRLDAVVAGLSGTDRSAFVCRAIEDYLGGIGTRRPPVTVRHETAPDPTLRALHIEDVRQGTNLNQLARAANTGALTLDEVRLFVVTEKRMRELFRRRDERMAALGYGLMDGQSPAYDGGNGAVSLP